VIQKRREFLEIAPAESPSRSQGKNNLATALLEYHTRKGRKGDLSEAIQILRDLADSTSPESVEFSTILLNLSNGLDIKYEHSGELRLLDESVECA
jgi:hypothetical protein